MKFTPPLAQLLGGEDFTHMLVDEVLKRADVARTTLNESELAALYACVEAAKCSNQSPLHIRWQYQEERGNANFTRTNWKICGCRCSSLASAD
ncbi:hypothetical protein [Escherichia coli]|uniref:hypothetical protein n=1 Tax=Escherichia coli TaxID=562 RepID=UPI000A9CCE6A|nr:hypothetical protein [Escherichia coli]